MARVILPALLVALAACTPAPPGPAEIEAFLGVPLPPGHSGLQVAEEAGIDRLMRLSFEAPADEVEAFAARLVPGGLAPDLDPGLAALGAGLEGWPTTLPPGARGGSRLSPGLAAKVVVAPVEPNRDPARPARRVWAAVFTL